MQHLWLPFLKPFQVFTVSLFNLSSQPFAQLVIGATTRSLGEQRQRELFVLLRSRCGTNDEYVKREQKGIVTSTFVLDIS